MDRLPAAYAAAVRTYAGELAALGYAATTRRCMRQRAAAACRYWVGACGCASIEAVGPGELERYYGELAGREAAAQVSEAVGRRYAREARGLLAAVELLNRIDAERLVEYAAVRAEVLAGAVADTQEWSGGGEGLRTWTREEVAGLYAATAAGSTARAVLALAYGCGLRRAEAAAVALGDVRTGRMGGGGVLVVARGKGGRRREVPLSAGTLRDLQAYVAGERAARLARFGDAAAVGRIDRLASGSGGLLVHARGGVMRDHTVAKVVGRIVARAERLGLVGSAANRRATCHGLRHAIATHLLGAKAGEGLTVAQVGQFLGHASIGTTERYVAVEVGHLKRLVS